MMKTLFMPLIYGKTVITMTSDIRAVYGELLTYSDSSMLAKLCYEFWGSKYPDIINLMKLINLIGWICSFLGREVIYSVDYFTTVQNYKRSKKAEIVVYDSLLKKKSRKVTLRVPTQDPDKRKTAQSTCVNFIHQKDAFIAMRLIERLTIENNPAPIYTVHDNFITIPQYAEKLPEMYIEVFAGMGHPLNIINEFLSLNLKNLSMMSYDDKVLKDMYHYKTHDFAKPLQSVYLRDNLRGLEPPGLTSKEKSLFENKIEEVVSCYESYTQTVIGTDSEKWLYFKRDLLEWKEYGYIYCLHY